MSFTANTTRESIVKDQLKAEAIAGVAGRMIDISTLCKDIEDAGKLA